MLAPPARAASSDAASILRRLIDSGRYEKSAAKLPGVDVVIVRYGPNDVNRREDFDANFPKDLRELLGYLRRDHPAAMIILATAIPLSPDLEVDALQRRA